jgi:hypothetical protein
MVEEARLEESEYGLTAATEGWFVVNVRDGAWMTNEALGAAFIVEGGDYEFPQLATPWPSSLPARRAATTARATRRTSSSSPASASS